MSNVEITFNLPEELLEQARAEGMPITDASIASMIEAELLRVQVARRQPEAMQKLEGMSFEDIDDELDAMAADPDIQREIKQIQAEFEETETDGLTDYT
jgi:hypothetical protein